METAAQENMAKVDNTYITYFHGCFRQGRVVLNEQENGKTLIQGQMLTK
jgi:hypothetical protein